MLFTSSHFSMCCGIFVPIFHCSFIHTGRQAAGLGPPDIFPAIVSLTLSLSFNLYISFPGC